MAVPRLRFGSKDWESVELQNIAQRVTRKNSQNETDLPLTISSLDGLVDQREYFKKQVASKDMSGYYLLHRGEFAYNKSYSAGFDFGSVKRLNKYAKGALSTLYICFSLKNVVNSDFFVGYFDSGKWNRHVSKVCTEGARNHGLLNISADDFMKMRIYLPDVAEQQKIADFLTTFDKRIAAQQNIIADLEETKKGLLQKIFTQEIRFKDDNGQEFPDWKDKRLGAICQIFKGAPLSKSDISAEGKPFILYGELYTTYSEVTYDIVRKTRTSVDERYYSEVGDVLVPTSGESAEEISTATCVMQKGVILAGDLNVVRSNVIDGRILSYMLNHTKKHDLSRVAQGISVVHSKAEDLKKLIISIPAVEEQQKIAAFLSAFDKKISAEKQILSDLKEIKKGLLQQMFV